MTAHRCSFRLDEATYAPRLSGWVSRCVCGRVTFLATDEQLRREEALPHASNEHAFNDVWDHRND